MRKILKSRFGLAGVLVFAVALTLAGRVLGQDVKIDDESYNLESAVNTLAENQLKLTKLLETSIFGPTSEEIKLISGASTALLSSSEVPFQGCLAGYTSWPSSNNFKEDGLFAMPFVQSNLGPLFTDINGDGILDYLGFTAYGGIYSGYGGCVMLGNGTDYDYAYRCVSYYSSGVWTFYGDCADI